MSIARFSDGAENEIRTHDPRITNALLYRLSYLGTASVPRKLQPPLKNKMRRVLAAEIYHLRKMSPPLCLSGTLTSSSSGYRFTVIAIFNLFGARSQKTTQPSIPFIIELQALNK